MSARRKAPPALPKGVVESNPNGKEELTKKLRRKAGWDLPEQPPALQLNHEPLESATQKTVSSEGAQDSHLDALAPAEDPPGRARHEAAPGIRVQSLRRAVRKLS